MQINRSVYFPFCAPPPTRRGKKLDCLEKGRGGMGKKFNVIGKYTPLHIKELMNLLGNFLIYLLRNYEILHFKDEL